MPLLDANGNPINQSGGSGTLSLAPPYAGDTLYGLIASYVLGAFTGWVAEQLVDFASEPIAIGTASGGTVFDEGDAVFLRFAFVGTTVRLQVGAPDDGVTYFDLAVLDATGSPLTFVYDNLAVWVPLILNTLWTLAERGWQINVAGAAALATEADMVAVGDVVKLVVEMRQFNQPIQISHHFKARTNAADFAALANSYHANVEPALRECMDVSVSVLGYRVEDRINTTNPVLLRRTVLVVNNPVTLGTQHDDAGVDVSAADAPQLASCVSWDTPFAGRDERGRSYVPGTTHAGAAGGLITDDQKALLSAWAAALTDRFGGTDANVFKAAASGVDPTWGLVLWRNSKTGPNAVENQIPDHYDQYGRAVYQDAAHQPRTTPPFNPLAADHVITVGIPRDRLRTQRRRGVDVRIGRRRLPAIVPNA